MQKSKKPIVDNETPRKDWERLDWERVLKVTSGFATSEMGRDLVNSTSALSSSDLAETQIFNILSAQKVLMQLGRPQLEAVDLYYVWFERLKKKAVLNGIEINDVKNFAEATLRTIELLGGDESSWSKSVLQDLLSPEPVLSAIAQIFTEGGDIRSDASETLFSLFKERNDLENGIRKSLDKIVKSFQLEHVLQDRYVTTRDGRWVLPVKSGMRSGLKGIIHDISQSKQTVFVEPQEIVETNNRLREVKSSIDEEVERLLRQLSTFLSGLSNDFESTFQALVKCDMIFAHAEFSHQAKSRPITFSEEGLDLRGLRHPLLSIELKDKVVPNSVEISSERSVLILSGPNAGGKTVLLKSIGLVAQMSRCGLPVCCAENSRIPFFNRILVNIGDSQSVGDHLSTFAAHLKDLTEAADLKGKDALILIDEICGSTDPEEGAALARSFVEHFSKQDVFSVITSHLGPLKQGWAKDSGVISGSMEYDEVKSQPTYELLLGIHGRSLAMKTAKVAGVPEKIVTRAYDFLDPVIKEKELRLNEVEDLRQEVLSLKERLKKDQSAMHAEKQKYENKIKEFDEHRDKWMSEALEKAQKEVNQKIKDAQKDPSKVDFSSFKANMPKIVKASQAQSKAEDISAPETDKEFETMFPPGVRVFVPSLKQDAIVQGVPNSKGEIPILSNSMRLQISWREVQPIDGFQGYKPKEVRRQKASEVLSGGQVVVDVRGQRVDEAIETLEVELDKAVLRKKDRMKVIHGHGTETLKKSIRAYLSRSVYVQKWVAGDKHESDGVTIAEL